MDSGRALLTIAIPTYSRCSHLKQLLTTLAPQLTNQKRLDVIVSDNASTDSTEQIVREFQSRGMPIRYFRNAVNLGAERNILQCYEEAKSKYVWILGDDDVIEPFGLEIILAHLLREDYDLIAIKTRGFTGDYEPGIRPAREKYTIFTRAEDLACHVHVFFTFISAIIVNKDRISDRQHRAFCTLLGTALIQLGWIYTALEHHQRSLAIHDPLVAAMVGNTGGYALFNVFGPNFKNVTEEWLSSPKVRRPIIHGTLQSFLPFFLSSNRANFLQEDPHVVLGSAYSRNFRYWVFDFPIIRLPSTMKILWFLGVRCINKIDRMAGNPLLRL